MQVKRTVTQTVYRNKKVNKKDKNKSVTQIQTASRPLPACNSLYKYLFFHPFCNYSKGYEYFSTMGRNIKI